MTSKEAYDKVRRFHGNFYAAGYAAIAEGRVRTLSEFSHILHPTKPRVKKATKAKVETTVQLMLGI